MTNHAYSLTARETSCMPLDKDNVCAVDRTGSMDLDLYLIKHAESDYDITKWVSEERWMILPLPYETLLRTMRSEVAFRIIRISRGTIA